MKNITIQVAHETSVVARVQNSVAAWLNRKNNLLSGMLEETVTNRQCCQVANLCTALTFMALVAALSNTMLIIGSVWLIAAGYPLAKGGLR